MNSPIYLDYAATTPVAPEVVQAMLPYLTLYGLFANPASIQHSPGIAVENVIRQARSNMAQLLNCSSDDVIFTSGATEANNLAIKGIVLAHPVGKHIITSTIEHKSVLDTCKFLEAQGYIVTYVRPDNQGRLRLETILEAITEQTILVSIMHVNNETGMIQDIAQIAQALKDKPIYFHVDAAQSAGKLSINLSELPVDLLSLSAHKFYGPKGVGCLFIRNRKRQRLIPLFHGGGQEFGLRPGTLPVHQIIGMVTAFELAHTRLTEDYLHSQQLRELLNKQLTILGEVKLNGDASAALPNIVNLSFSGVSADALIIALRDQVALSSGSACNSGAIEASHVLRSMNIEGDRLYEAIRLSFGRYTRIIDIQLAATILCDTVRQLRHLALE